MYQNPSATSSLSIPKVVVLIPHFNNPTGLKNTLASLSYSGFIDVVIVDDGSFEKPKKEDFPISRNLKMHFHYLQKNQGVEKALNEGISFIKKNIEAKYIARIDSGDLQLADRLDKQVSFLEDNQDVGILGTAAEFVGKNGALGFLVKYPQNNKKIKKHMGLRCSLLHPTVMFRTSLLQNTEAYPDKYPYADDYAFFYSLLNRTKAANLQEVLTRIDQCGKSISVKNRKRQLKSRIKVIYDNFSSSPLSIFGIIYTSIMMLVPYELIIHLKRRLS